MIHFKRTDLSLRSIREFQDIIYRCYHENPRDFPWRKTDSPYRILLSEIMLQQTQVERVMDKYKEFVGRFPSFSSLAKAPLQEVFRVWRGLGYNRRAVALKKIAQVITEEFHGRLPSSEKELTRLSGIGKYTASAIAAFAFRKPSVFIETNIRRVFIHFFFSDRENVKDSEILPLVEKTLDRSNPKEWYYALMDYGATLKRDHGNPNRKSAHYRRQTPFKGSSRQIRGMILRLLVERPGLTASQVLLELETDPEKTREGIEALRREGFLRREGGRLLIA